MAVSQEQSVQNEVEEVVVVSVEEVAEQGKRGRNPLTHADIMARIVAPNPVDKSFGEFAESKFAAITAANGDVETAFILGGILGRWSTVVKWWNESDEIKSAKDAITAWEAEQEMAAKVAKLSPTEKAEFDAAPESVKAMILRFISL